MVNPSIFVSVETWQILLAYVDHCDQVHTLIQEDEISYVE